MGEPVFYCKIKWNFYGDGSSVHFTPKKGKTWQGPQTVKLSEVDAEPEITDMKFLVSLEGVNTVPIRSKSDHFNNLFAGQSLHGKYILCVGDVLGKAGKKNYTTPGSSNWAETVFSTDYMDGRKIAGISGSYLPAQEAKKIFKEILRASNAEHVNNSAFNKDMLLNADFDIQPYLDWLEKRKADKKAKDKADAKAEKVSDTNADEENNKSSDFWTNGSNSEQAVKNTEIHNPSGNPAADNSSSQSDFWKEGASTPASKPVTAQKTAQEQKDFWDSGGASLDKQDGKFWQGDGNSGATEDYEIKTIDGRQGVIAASGRTLIPFREWQIISYKSGIALVSKSEKRHDRCATRINNSKGWSYTVTAKKSGYVDLTGEFLTPPQLRLTKDLHTFGPVFYLTSERCCLSYEEEQAAKRQKEKRDAIFREQMDDCHDDMRLSMGGVVDTYRAKGYR